MSTYYLGIDAGTGSIRAAVFHENGSLLGSAEAAYPTYYPANGCAEQDTEEWLAALKTAVPDSLKKAGIPAEALNAIVCDATTNTLVFLDASGKPVRRPLLWMDVRAAAEAAELDQLRQKNADAFPAMDVYLPSFRADTMIPKCMWYKRHEAVHWTATKTLFEFEDWLNYQLTGEVTLSKSVAAFRWNYDEAQGGLPAALYEAVGIADVMEKIPERQLSIGEQVGCVTEAAAEAFGLHPGTPVYEGTCDCNAAMLGSGCIRAGSIIMVSGTSTAILGLSDTPFHTAGVNGTYPDCIFPGTGLAESGQTASGAVLTWFKNTLLPAAWAKEAEARSLNIYDLISEKAASAPIGAGGVIMLDYFQGNRAPYADSAARGAFMGLSIGTDAACIARAIYEGVAYGAAHCIQVMRASGMEIKEVLACGGICSSPFWLQLHADVLGLPITTAGLPGNAAQLGNALIGAASSGLYPDIPAAAAPMVRTGETYIPDSKAHQAYRFYMDRYLELWPALRETTHRLVRHEADGRFRSLH